MRCGPAFPEQARHRRIQHLRAHSGAMAGERFGPADHPEEGARDLQQAFAQGRGIGGGEQRIGQLLFAMRLHAAANNASLSPKWLYTVSLETPASAAIWSMLTPRIPAR
jgi:hypothetical protein